MDLMRVSAVVLGVCLAPSAVGDEGKDETRSDRIGGILTATEFQPLDEAEVYGGGPYTSVFIRGSAALVFPFETEVETSTAGDDLELSSKIGVGYNVGVGLRFGPGPNPSDPGVGYRFEGEFAQRFYDTDDLVNEEGDSIQDVDGDIEVTTVMANALFDVTTEGIRGYMGFGAGVATVDAEIDGESDEDTSFALQIPIGCEIRVVENVWIDVGTRWMYVPGLDIDTDIEELSILTGDLHVGLVIEF